MKGCLVMGSPYRSVDIFKALEEAQVERVNSIELLNEFHKVGKHVLGKKLPIAITELYPMRKGKTKQF